MCGEIFFSVVIGDSTFLEIHRAVEFTEWHSNCPVGMNEFVFVTWPLRKQVLRITEKFIAFETAWRLERRCPKRHYFKCKIILYGKKEIWERLFGKSVIAQKIPAMQYLVWWSFTTLLPTACNIIFMLFYFKWK